MTTSPLIEEEGNIYFNVKLALLDESEYMTKILIKLVHKD